MKKEPNDLHEYTVQEFLITLCGLLKNKQIKETDKLIISSDEEGNSFSGVLAWFRSGSRIWDSYFISTMDERI